MKINIKTIEIAGLASALQALRLPYKKECRSEITNDFYGLVDDPEIKSWRFESSGIINEKDLQLMSTLVKRGDEHCKALRALVVYAEIDAPLSFWAEADTYRIGTERLSSESTMHTIGNGGVNIYDFNVPDILYEILGDDIPKEKVITPLRIDTPKELKSVIKSYFGREYEIWNNGEIYALPFDTDEILPNGATRKRHFDKQKIKTGNTRNQQGYYQVRLGGRKGKTMVLHRILADAFVENPKNYNIVNHKDGDKGNCSISNLEWCTSSYNNKHAFENGLREVTIKDRYYRYKASLKWTNDDIEQWRKLKDSGKTSKEIARIYETSEHTISQYLKGKRYNHLSEYSEWFELAKKYEDTINLINDYSALYKETGDFKYVLRIKEILPTSFKQKRIQMFSYPTLRRIYKQRHNHRLPMWHDFCAWVESLPFADTLIIPDKENM